MISLEGTNRLGCDACSAFIGQVDAEQPKFRLVRLSGTRFAEVLRVASSYGRLVAGFQRSELADAGTRAQPSELEPNHRV